MRENAPKGLLPLGVGAAVFLFWSLLNLNIPFYYDDIWQILKNPGIRDLFSPGQILHDYLRPGRIIQNASFAFNWWVSGDRPWSYHLVNNLLHALNTVLVFLLTARLTRHRRQSLFVALLFGIHPLQLQPVTYVMGRVSLLETFFSLLIVLLFLGHPRRKLLIMVLLLVALAAKETCVLIPPLLLGIDLLRRAKIPWREHGLYATQILLGVPLIKYFSYQHGGAVGLNLYPPAEYALVQLHNVGFYLRLFVDPSRQSILHPYPAAIDGAILAYAAAGLVAGAALIGVLLPRRHRLSRGFPVLWGLFAFVPYHSFLQYVNPFAEYRLYQSNFALAFGIGFVVRAALRRPAAQHLVAAALLVCCAAFTFQMHLLWRNPYTLYRYSLQLYPEDAEINAMVGIEYARKRDLENAETFLTRALERDWTRRTPGLREDTAKLLEKVLSELERERSVYRPWLPPGPDVSQPLLP